MPPAHLAPSRPRYTQPATSGEPGQHAQALLGNARHPGELLRAALRGAEEELLGTLSSLERPLDRKARAEVLGALIELELGTLASQWESRQYASEPGVVGLRRRLTREWFAELEAELGPEGEPNVLTAAECMQSMRKLAATERLPAVYHWVAKTASLNELTEFLEHEGGPDAGFDDLVARAQVGIEGIAKVEMAVNYWDELGNGAPARVHTELHRAMSEALGLRRLPDSARSVEGLERANLHGALAVDRYWQPELLGALGLTELQAGPRCRLVAQGLRRVGAPGAALPFYEEHADVDPRHGLDWLERVIAPLAEEFPAWSGRMVRGAQWRARLNQAFFARMSARFAGAGAP